MGNKKKRKKSLKKFKNLVALIANLLLGLGTFFAGLAALIKAIAQALK